MLTDEEAEARALRGCVGKIGHLTRKSARDSLRRVLKGRPSAEVRASNVYKCSLCGRFHWGHATKA